MTDRPEIVCICGSARFVQEIRDANLDLAPFPAYTHAERCLSGTLWKRGIGLMTGELQLAATLIRYWSIEERVDGRIADRVATIGIDSLDADSVFLVADPEVVRLTAILTDLSFASYLLSPRFSLAEQVLALEAAVFTVMNGCTTPHPHHVAERIVARGKRPSRPRSVCARTRTVSAPRLSRRHSSHRLNGTGAACSGTSAQSASRSSTTNRESRSRGTASWYVGNLCP